MESHKHNDQSLSTWWQELQGLATSSGSGEIPQAVLLNPYIHLDPGSVWSLHCKHDPLLSNISNDMQSISYLNYLQEKVLWLSQHLSGFYYSQPSNLFTSCWLLQMELTGGVSGTRFSAWIVNQHIKVCNYHLVNRSKGLLVCGGESMGLSKIATWRAPGLTAGDEHTRQSPDTQLHQNCNSRTNWEHWV